MGGPCASGLVLDAQSWFKGSSCVGWSVPNGSLTSDLGEVCLGSGMLLEDLGPQNVAFHIFDATSVMGGFRRPLV